MNNDPRYTGVGGALPAMLPPLTRPVALKRYLQLVRAFGGVKHMPVGVAERRMNRPIKSNRTRCGFGWASSKPTRGDNNSRGWGRLIHDASHYVFRCRHPHARPHDGGHSTLERELAAYVHARGWLVETVKPVTPRLDATGKLARIEAAIIRWDAKARRAKTALAKLNRRAKYYRSKTT